MLFSLLLTPLWAFMNWTTLEISTLETLKTQHSLTILTEKNCSICQSYLKEVVNCPKLQSSKVAVIAIGDNAYLRKLKNELPATVTLLKANQKQMSGLVRLTPTTWTSTQIFEGFQSCNKISQEVTR